MRWFPSQPVGLPGVATLAVCAIAFLIALIVARARRGPADAAPGRRSRRSWLGVMTQGLGIMLVGVGPVHIVLPPTAPQAIVAAALVLLLAGGAVALFAWATRTMGRNWSLVARTRSDHSLVTDGPFAYVRHPIYSAMALFMSALAVAYGHYWHLILGTPVFARGTWLRIREEEALLRAAFGDAYDAYAARVRRFVPGLF